MNDNFPLKNNIFNYSIFTDYHDAVFVVGSLDETLILRGMRYHPIDIENSVMRAHKKIAEWYVILFFILIIMVTVVIFHSEAVEFQRFLHSNASTQRIL